MENWYASEDIPEWILNDEEPAAPVCSWDQIVLASTNKPVSLKEVLHLQPKSNTNQSPRPAGQDVHEPAIPICPWDQSSLNPTSTHAFQIEEQSLSHVPQTAGLDAPHPPDKDKADLSTSREATMGH